MIVGMFALATQAILLAKPSRRKCLFPPVTSVLPRHRFFEARATRHLSGRIILRSAVGRGCEDSCALSRRTYERGAAPAANIAPSTGNGFDGHFAIVRGPRGGAPS